MLVRIMAQAYLLFIICKLSFIIMKDSVIIVSGGMDSITLLYDKKDEIALGISFNYGSNHNAKEIPFAKMHCERLGIKHITIDLGFMHQYFKSSLLEGADAIPEGHYADDNMKSTVVPFRNGIMLSIAETWSCYKGGEKHCGKCGTCVERKEALAEAGIEDTTEYEG